MVDAKAEPRRVQATDFNFDSAPAYRKTKTLPATSVAFARGGESISTLQTSNTGEPFVETTNAAKPGDVILTRAPGDQYVISAESFEKLYERDPSDPARYRSRNFGRAIRVAVDSVIKAPWGEDQRIEAGGVIYENRATGGVYGNQKSSFEEDFAREAADGSLMPLSAPPDEQASWALAKGEAGHLADIRR